MTVVIIPWICLWALSSEKLKALSLPISSLSPTSQGSVSYYPSLLRCLCTVTHSRALKLASLSPGQGEVHMPLSSLPLGHPISWTAKKPWLAVHQGVLEHERNQR